VSVIGRLILRLLAAFFAFTGGGVPTCGKQLLGTPK
jgi:hypothetical protein